MNTWPVDTWWWWWWWWRRIWEDNNSWNGSANHCSKLNFFETDLLPSESEIFRVKQATDDRDLKTKEACLKEMNTWLEKHLMIMKNEMGKKEQSEFQNCKMSLICCWALGQKCSDRFWVGSDYKQPNKLRKCSGSIKCTQPPIEDDRSHILSAVKAGHWFMIC